MTNQAPRYDTVAISLHWVIFLAMLSMFVVTQTMEDLKGLEKAPWLNLHKSFGITIWSLTAFRLFWRWRHPAPASELSRWLRWASSITHTLLYILLFLVPIQGGLLAFFSGYPGEFFTLFPIPAGIADRSVYDFIKPIHHLMGDLFFLLIFLHILASLFHGLILRDRVLFRMLPFRFLLFGRKKVD